MVAWASLMLIAGGLFAGGAATFAWSRVPTWRRMLVQEFVGDLEETLRRTDKGSRLAGVGDRLGSRVRSYLRRLGARARVARAAPAEHLRGAAREV